MGLYTSLPEPKATLCLFAKRLGQNKKNNSPNAQASLKTATPFVTQNTNTEAATHKMDDIVIWPSLKLRKNNKLCKECHTRRYKLR